MSIEPIEQNWAEDAAAWDAWWARHEARKAERLAQREAVPVAEPERTTKRVRATLDVTFHGDYVDADEIPGHLEAWIDAGLNDRSDCRTWSLSVTAVTVESGDPDGWDR